MKVKWFFLLETAILCIVFVGFCALFVLDSKIYPVKFRQEITTYANQFGTQPEIVASIIKAESYFKFDAKSEKGAIGLMQIMPQTAKFVCQKLGEEYSESKLLLPQFNIKVGCYYFCYLQTKFNNLKTQICAYNAGEGNVKNWLKNKKYSANGITLNVVPFKETEIYTKKVLKNLSVYKTKF